MVRRIVASVAATALLAACGVGKPPEPPRQIRLTARIGSFQIQNGVRGVLAGDPGSKNAVVVMRLAVGSTSDPKGKAGLAHLAEHIVFDLPVAGKTLGTRLAEVALFYNAETHYDYTMFYAVGPADKLAPILAIDAEFINQGCHALSDEEFAREREVVRNEIRGHRSGRGGDLLSILTEAAFPPGHPYHRTTGGDDEQLVSITKQELCKFLDDYYTPDKVLLSLTGGISEKQVGPALNATFARLPKRAGKPTPKVADVPDSQLGKRTETETDVDLPMAVVLFRMPPANTPERLAAEMVSSYAAERANQITDTYGLGAGIIPFSVGGESAELAGVVIQLTDAGQADAAVDGVFKAFGHADRYFADLDFEHNRSVEQLDLVNRYDVPLSRAEALAGYQQRGQLKYFFGDLDMIRSLDRDQARRAAERIFRKENAVVIVVKPNQAVTREYHRAAPPLSAVGSDEDSQKIDVDPSDAARPMQLPIAGLDTEVRELTLKNGMRVLLAPSGSAPVVKVRLLLAGGKTSEPDGKSGIAEIATSFLGVKLDQTAADEVRAALWFYRSGSRFGASVGDDFTVFSASGLTMYVDHLLAGFERRIRTGPYDQEAIERFVKAKKVELSTPSSREGLLSQKALYAETYGADHPYATRGFWLESDLGHLGHDAANDFRDRNFVGANATLIITGQFDADLVEKYVRYQFDDWPSGSASAPVTAPAKQHPGDRPLAAAVEGSNADQINVAVTFPLPAGVSDDYARIRLMEQMVGQQVKAIREEMGASYGFYAQVDTNRGPGMLAIQGSVDAPRAGAALKELLAGLERLRSGADGFDEDFVEARRELARALLTDAESAGAIASRLAFSARYHLPLDYRRQLAADVAKTTAAAMHPTINRYLRPGAARIILVGTKENVDAAFAAAGFQPGEVDRIK